MSDLRNGHASNRTTLQRCSLSIWSAWIIATSDARRPILPSTAFMALRKDRRIVLPRLINIQNTWNCTEIQYLTSFTHGISWPLWPAPAYNLLMSSRSQSFNYFSNTMTVGVNNKISSAHKIMYNFYLALETEQPGCLYCKHKKR